MGRYSTGAITTRESKRLELSYLLNDGYIQKGLMLSGTIRWNNGSSINFISELTEENQYIRLQYQNTSYEGEEKDMDYMIHLASIPSNLDRGRILYFICPITGRRSRILYKCYGSLYFKSREAYHNRIYYQCQISSKLYYHSNRFHSIESTLERMPAIKKQHYRGKETRIQQRIRLLESKQEYHDALSWQALTKIM